MLHHIFSWHRLINVIWLIFLFGLFWHFLQKWLFLNKARSWLITKGQITQFTIEQEGHHLWPRIQYSYRVYDRDFEGEYFFLDTSHNNPQSRYARQIAHRAAMAFKKNEEIEVFYNPDDPRQAALDIQIPKKLTFILIFLMSLFLINLGLSLHQYL